MFYKYKKLNEINLSSFNTKNVIDTKYIFSHCSNLNEIDLSSFIIQDNINMEGIFSFCEELK